MDENLIIRLEKQKVVTATFRKLEPSRKNQIYQAALRAFAGDIFERVPLDLIAEGAVVSKGSLVQYFGEKENLLKFVAAVFLDEYQKFWEDYFMREHAVRAKERIVEYLKARLAQWEKEKTNFKFFMKMQYENRLELTAEFRESIAGIRTGFLQKIIERGMETGEIRRDLGMEPILFVILAVTSYLEKLYLAGMVQGKGKGNLEETISQMIDPLFDGIAG
jgi:TetR/AcrR family transcriptional regulator, cholesterol catabolism regulator